MRVAGRITVCGEGFGSLLPRATFSVPTIQAFYCGPEARIFNGETRYRADRDEIGRILVSGGHIESPRTDIVGDLPLQYGLASSTALALAHLSDMSRQSWPLAVADSDRRMHGFTPSGADFAAVFAAQSGCFGIGEWTPIDFRLPAGSHLLLPPQEGKTAKLETALQMRADVEVLAPIIETVTKSLVAGRGLPIEPLFAYAQRLLQIGVYSPQQRSVIEHLLSNGVVAKGVGSMYDRAILVMADTDVWRGEPPFEVVAQEPYSADEPFKDMV
jgi:hypothetical protein